MNRELLAALEDLVEERVRPSRHALVVDGVSVRVAFLGLLARAGFVPLRVAEAIVAPGVRYPAWLVREDTAWFGHLFQEKFTEGNRRTLFASLARDPRGDWEVTVTRRSPERVWAHLGRGASFDEDRPSSL